MLKRINTTDQNLQLIQDNVDAELVKIQTAEFFGGVLFSNITLTTGQDNAIANRLGKVPRIVVIGAPSVDARVWNTSSDSKFIHLSCSATCVVNIWAG